MSPRDDNKRGIFAVNKEFKPSFGLGDLKGKLFRAHKRGHLFKVIERYLRGFGNVVFRHLNLGDFLGLYKLGLSDLFWLLLFFLFGSSLLEFCVLLRLSLRLGLLFVLFFKERLDGKAVVNSGNL